jgi:hypothetical protein
MADLHVADGTLIVDLSAAERFFALHFSTPKIPTSAITGVTAVPDVYAQLRGIRAPGLGIPGRTAVGTWRGRGYKDFAVIYRRGPGVVVTTRDFPYERVLIGTDDAAEGEAIVAKLS